MVLAPSWHGFYTETKSVYAKSLNKQSVKLGKYETTSQVELTELSKYAKILSIVADPGCKLPSTKQVYDSKGTCGLRKDPRRITAWLLFCRYTCNHPTRKPSESSVKRPTDPTRILR